MQVKTIVFSLKITLTIVSVVIFLLKDCIR